MVIEQFLCCWSGKPARAHAVREGVGGVKRLNKKHMQLGWDATVAQVFDSASLVPKFVIGVPSKSKRGAGKSGGKKEKGGGGDYARRRGGGAGTGGSG